MPFPPKVDPEKFCEVCGVKMTRKRYNGRLEDHLKLHWREDREKRLAGVRRGVTTRQQSIAGNSSLGGQRLHPLNQPAGTERGD